MHDHQSPPSERSPRNTKLIIAGLCGAFLCAAWVAKASLFSPLIVNTLIGASLVIGAVPALGTSIQKLRQFRFDIDSLMLVGAILSVCIGNPFEGALLLFLFALSGGLESFALDRTRRAINSLNELAPRYANLLINGAPQRVPLSELTLGAQVLVRAGEKVPVDGTIVEGHSSVNEAVITGEHLPRDLKSGDKVLAGTQNLNGRLVVTVERVGEDTTIGRIVELVTKAEKNPARTQRTIDRIGPVYSAAVVTVAVLVGVVCYFVLPQKAEAVRRAITVLIVSSPCALVIATPVAYLAAIAAAARRGVLIKGGEFLETISHARAIIFDKTGTLTTGEPVLQVVEPLNGLSEADSLRFAAALESSNTHPLSLAIMRRLKSENLESFAVNEFESIPGAGSKGTVDGHRVWIGKPESALKFAPLAAHSLIEPRVAEMRGDGATVSVLVVDEKVALFGFAETIRPNAAESIRQLRALGVSRMEMFTGDHRAAAQSLSTKIGLDACHADLHPEQKLSLAAQLQKEWSPVLMVGDGVNDAPALASVDVGIAMGISGADVTLDAADVVLMNDRLESLAWLLRHSKRTTTIVLQNLTLAIGVISVLTVFAAFGKIPLPVAVLGHEGSTVLVALNALRLLRGNGKS